MCKWTTITEVSFLVTLALLLELLKWNILYTDSIEGWVSVWDGRSWINLGKGIRIENLHWPIPDSMDFCHITRAFENNPWKINPGMLSINFMVVITLRVFQDGIVAHNHMVPAIEIIFLPYCNTGSSSYSLLSVVSQCLNSCCWTLFIIQFYVSIC